MKNKEWKTSNTQNLEVHHESTHITIRSFIQLLQHTKNEITDSIFFQMTSWKWNCLWDWSQENTINALLEDTLTKHKVFLYQLVGVND